MAEKGKYSYELITPAEKDKLLNDLAKRYLFDRKANIHGICIELLTDNKDYKEMWEDNFYSMSHDIRPHGRIVAVRDENPAVRVLYDLLGHRTEQQTDKLGAPTMAEDDQVDLVPVGTVDDLLCGMPYCDLEMGLNAGAGRDTVFHVREHPMMIIA